MRIEDAIELLKGLKVENRTSQRWADLGCGDGLFSSALATFLPGQSRILGIDKTTQDWREDSLNNVALEFIKADFSVFNFEPGQFDGFLMANSLHYIKDKLHLLNRLIQALRPDGKIVVIEYETSTPNSWVPYPISYDTLKLLFSEIGQHAIRKIGERPSRFGSKMYCGEIALRNEV